MFYKSFYSKRNAIGSQRNRAALWTNRMSFAQSKSPSVNPASGSNWVDTVPSKYDSAYDSKVKNWSRFQNQRYSNSKPKPLGRAEKFLRNHPRLTNGLISTADKTWRYFGKHIAKGLLLREGERRGKNGMNTAIRYKRKSKH